MNGAAAEALSAGLLVAVLAFAVVRPRGWPEAVVAVPAAGIVVAAGAVSSAHAWAEISRLLPVVGFLAAVLVLAQLCDDDGLFAAAGTFMGRICRGRPPRLLTAVFAVAALVTAVLSLDATVVLLTPAVIATAAAIGARPRPHVYAGTHLANTASLLLPVSNLTNLLAFSATGMSFVRFSALMSAPWLAAIAVEYAVLRRWFAADLTPPAAAEQPVAPRRMPRVTIAVLALTLGGFVATSFVGINPAWVALAGALALSARAVARGQTTFGRLIRATNVPFLAFVLALSVVVSAVVGNGLGTAADRLLPGGSSLPALLGVAACAALLANLINNLPAVLVLLPVAVANGPASVLAVLIGVNIGPNLTYVGSLATLLWRRVLARFGTEPRLGEYTRLGLLTVPAAIGGAVLALWLMLHTVGVGTT